MKNNNDTKFGLYLKFNNKGITLVALIVTIVVLLILASVATYSGIDAIENSKYTKFKSELKIMQTYINSWYEECKSADETKTFKDNITAKFANIAGKNVSAPLATSDSQAQITLNTIGITTQEAQANYFVLKEQQKEALGIESEGVTQDVLVSIVDRKVVSYLGMKYKDQMYYTLDDLGEFYNVEYNSNTNTGEPTFKVKEESATTSKATITVYDVSYTDGYIEKWKVLYKKTNESNWSVSNNLSFDVNSEAKYDIRLSSLTGDVVNTTSTTIPVFLIHKQNSTLANDTDKTKMNSKNPVIPQGFRAVNINANAASFEGDSTATWEYTDNTKTVVSGWNNGLVIEDEIGNQFVWVPCSLNEIQESGEPTIVAYSKNFNYPSNYSASDLNTANSFDTTTVDGQKYSAIPVIENEQVNNYGGFYVARFEAGLPTETLEQSATLNNVYTSIPVSKYGSKVWNYIDYTHSYVAAEKMINNKAKYGQNKSGLITGTQWDTIMQWYEANSIPVLKNNQNWGTYKNTNYTINGLNFMSTTTNLWNNSTVNHSFEDSTYLYHGTGMNNGGYKNNIADLGGNFWEWQSEQLNSSNANDIYRGGDAGNVYTMYPSSYRCYNSSTRSIYQIGFRTVLYIQDEPQKEYVTDGLLAYYDAENNTGTGHSFTTTTWKDLSGNNNDAILYGFGETATADSGWHANYLAFDGVDDFASKTSITVNGANGTIEIVGKYIDGKYMFRSNASGARTYIYHHYTANGDPATTVPFNTTLYNKLSSRVLKYYTENSISKTLNYYNMNKSEEIEYQTASNGSYLSIGSFNYNNPNQCAQMQVYAVRVYNRALTEEEIRQNYEIDKVRFNIQE